MNGSPELKSMLMDQQAKGHKDYRLQLDQWVGDHFEVSAVYYNGMASALDPGNTISWQNSFDAWRFYLHYSVLPSTLDLEAGVGSGSYHFVGAGSGTVSGSATDKGVSLEALYYPMPHLTLQARGDFFEYSDGLYARGGELVLSAPFENNIFLLSFNQLSSDVTGVASTAVAEWKLVF